MISILTQEEEIMGKGKSHIKGKKFQFKKKGNVKIITLSYDSVVIGFGILHDCLYMLGVFSIYDTGENLVLDINVVRLLKTLPCYGISV
ncbi:hypothetical protein CR513_47178, partial [Mucuna pruriens]